LSTCSRLPVSQPDRETLDKLGPWSSAATTGYEAQYLAGFDAPRYDVEVEQGFGAAQQDMASVIEGDCRSDIGGDEQQVSSMQTYDAEVLFGLLLLPLWVATYVLGGAVFDVYLNANTGKVIRERPYSWVKITAAVIAALLVIGTVVLVYPSNR